MERYEPPRPLFWVAVCDVPGCKEREALIRVEDVVAIALDGTIPEVLDEDDLEQVRRREVHIARAIACGRGWRFGTHVGEPEHMTCPRCQAKHAAVGEAVRHG